LKVFIYRLPSRALNLVDLSHVGRYFANDEGWNGLCWRFWRSFLEVLVGAFVDRVAR
jgi:hypothetical protein